MPGAPVPSVPPLSSIVLCVAAPIRALRSSNALTPSPIASLIGLVSASAARGGVPPSTSRA
jgi:hypothetical protein